MLSKALTHARHSSPSACRVEIALSVKRCWLYCKVHVLAQREGIANLAIRIAHTGGHHTQQSKSCSQAKSKGYGPALQVAEPYIRPCSAESSKPHLVSASLIPAEMTAHQLPAKKDRVAAGLVS